MQAVAWSMEPTGAAALAGKATCVAGAARSGLLVVGDDRGEVSLWDAAGRPLPGFRMPAPIASVTVSADASRRAAADVEGRVRITDGNAEVVFDVVVPGTLIVRTTTTGDCFHLVDPVRGQVEIRNGHGHLIQAFDVPEDIVGYAIDATEGAPVILTRHGVVVRFTPWGRQTWARDFATGAADLAVDLAGSLLSVALHRRGAECLLPDGGVPFGNFTPNFPVSAVALAEKDLLLGGSDGSLELSSRTGTSIARCSAGGPVRRVVLFEGETRAAALLADGRVRFFGAARPGSAPRAVPAAVSGSAVRGAAPAVVFRRSVCAPGDVGKTVRLAVAPGGGAFAVVCGTHLHVFDRAGALIESGQVTGETLALRLDNDRRGLLVTSKELRPLVHSDSGLRQRFILTAIDACVPADGACVSVLDEYGGVRVIERSSGEDLLYDLGASAVPARRIVASGRQVCVQAPEQVFRLLSPEHSTSFHIPVLGEALPRLAAALPNGPVVVRGGEIFLTGWDGEPAWTCAPGPLIGEVIAGPEGQLLVCGAFGAAVFDESGVLRGKRQRIQGRAADVTGGARDPVLVIVDGGRVVLATAAGRALWHVAFDAEVRVAQAVNRGGLLAAIVGHELIVVAGAVARDPGVSLGAAPTADA